MGKKMKIFGFHVGMGNIQSLASDTHSPVILLVEVHNRAAVANLSLYKMKLLKKQNQKPKNFHNISFLTCFMNQQHLFLFFF